MVACGLGPLHSAINGSARIAALASGLASRKHATRPGRARPARARDHLVPGLPAAGRVAGAGRGRPAAPVPRRGVLGAAGAGLRRSASAAIVLVGLAPAANGANRTGRMFTGDRSGDWLYAALYRAGLANQPTSVDRDDGLRLDGAYVTAAVRCAPPANKPTPAERDDCRPYLDRELALLPSARVLRRARLVRVGRGAAGAGDAGGRSRGRSRGSGTAPRRRSGRVALLGSYHPSQQNTFTGEADRGDARRRPRRARRRSPGAESGADARVVSGRASDPGRFVVPLNIPNALTMLRILVVPVVVVALLGEIPNGDALAGDRLRARGDHRRPRRLHRPAPPGRDDVRQADGPARRQAADRRGAGLAGLARPARGLDRDGDHRPRAGGHRRCGRSPSSRAW